MKQPTAVSLFSGCGGFDWGASKAGVKIVWANDFDTHAAAAYKSILPKVEFHLGDIRKVKDFPKADILIGCYPCTGFSEAAKRKAEGAQDRDLLNNPGNYLYREFMRALRQIKPKFLFVENVRGMLSAADGWFLERQMDGFRRHGYKVKLQMLKATNYGVAQERRRIFIVGQHSSVVNFEYQFPSPTHGVEGKPRIRVLRDVLGKFKPKPDDEVCLKNFHGHYLTRNRKKAWNEPSYTIVAHACHVPLHPSGEPMKHVGTDQYALQGDLNRRLSWRECVAIQGLPGKIKPTGTLRAKYRVVGNAVPPKIGQALVEPVVKYLQTLE